MRERLKSYMDGNPDNLGINNMWKQYKKASLNLKYGKSSAKLDHEGNLVAETNDITEVLRKEIAERLRERPIKSDLKELDNLKKKLFENIMEIAKAN